MKDLWFLPGATVLVEISGTTVAVPLTAPAACPVCTHPMSTGAAVCGSCSRVVIR